MIADQNRQLELEFT